MNYCSRLHNAQLWKDSQWLVLRQESKYHRSSRNLKNSHQDGSERGLQFFNIRTGMKQNGPVGTQVSLIKNIRVKVFVAYTWEKRYKWTLTIWWRQVRTHIYEEQQNGENKRTYLTFWNDAKLSNGSACLNNKTFTLAPLTAYKRTVFFENNGVIIVQLDESCPVPLTEIAVRNSEPYIWTFKNNPL